MISATTSLNPSALAFKMMTQPGRLPGEEPKRGPKSNGKRIAYSPQAADAAIRSGLPGSSMKTVKRLYRVSNRVLGQLVGIAGDKTLAKRLEASHLSSVESDRVWRLLRVYCAAWIALDGDDAAATQWFQTPASRLGGKVPLHLLQTEEGVKLVLDALTAIEHGLPV